MNFANIFFFASYVLAILAVIGDFVSSKPFIYHGLTEKNKLTRDKYGYFDAKKNMTFSAVSMVTLLIAGIGGILLKESFVVMLAAIMSLVVVLIRGFFGWYKNTKALKRGRERQTIFLRKLKATIQEGASEEIIQTQFQTLVWKEKADRKFYELFGFIYSIDTSTTYALNEVQNRIKELATKDESQWFKN